MTFDNALSHAIDYGKFIFQIWNYYIVLILAMIGWLVTLRSKPSTLDLQTRLVLIASYVLVSVIFWAVLQQNHAVLIQLMTLVHHLAQDDAKSAILSKTYGSEVNSQFVLILNRTSSVGLPFIVFCTGVFMWLISGPPQQPVDPSRRTES